MHRPKQTPVPKPPDTSALDVLLTAKGPVTVGRLALSATQGCPIAELAQHLWEGPIGGKFQCGPVTVYDFATEGERQEYIRALTAAVILHLPQHVQRIVEHYTQSTDTVDALQVIHSALVADFIFEIIRARLLDGLFIVANRGAGYGFREALHHLEHGDSVQQREALLQLLHAFGEEFLADLSFPLIRSRYLEHTRSNRTFAKEAHAALTTAFRRAVRPLDPRRKLVLALALRPELLNEHFKGNMTAQELMDTVAALKGHGWRDESAKTFAQFVSRTFQQRKDAA